MNVQRGGDIEDESMPPGQDEKRDRVTRIEKWFMTSLERFEVIAGDDQNEVIFKLIMLNSHEKAEMKDFVARLKDGFHSLQERRLLNKAYKLELAPERMAFMRDCLAEGIFVHYKRDMIAGMSCLGLAYATYAYTIGTGTAPAIIGAYELIPGMGGAAALYSFAYMAATFGIPESMKAIKEGSLDEIPSKWLRCLGALTEVGFLCIPLLKDKRFNVSDIRLLSEAALSRIKRYFVNSKVALAES